MKMQELQHSPETASWIAPALAFFWKFMPGPLGALVMIAVDTPKTKTELFWRLVVAYIATVMLGDILFDFLRSFSTFAFLSPFKKTHTAAVDFVVGGCGWFVLGGAAMWLRRFQSNPVAAIAEAKEKVL
jgi:hypothetical protein